MPFAPARSLRPPNSKATSMSPSIPDHIDIPYCDEDGEVALEVLRIFNFEPDDSGVNIPAARFEEDFEGLVAELVRILSEIRLTAVIPSGRLGDKLVEQIYPLVLFWYYDLDREWPWSTFPEPEVGGRPMAGSGADFVYVVLKAIGVKFDDHSFRIQFDNARRKAATDVGYELEFENDDGDQV